ncbi:hypothetical protein GQ457_09G022050 [Hibiscus cannabinus]
MTYALSFPTMHIVSSGRQGSKGDRVKPLFKYGFCECGSVNKQWGGICIVHVDSWFVYAWNVSDRFLARFWHVASQIPACLVSSIGTLTGYRYPNSTLEFGYRYQLGRVSVPLVSIPAIRVSIPP